MRVILLIIMFSLCSCVGKYDLKGYDLGMSAGKNLYGNPDLGLSPNAYTTVNVNASFHFTK